MLIFLRGAIPKRTKMNDTANLYKTLGDEYASVNADQAYLCYENALYHCLNMGDEDATDIRDLMDIFAKEHSVSVRKVSFVILSYNTLEYTKMCIESIRRTCYKDACEIIVADNASTDGSVAWLRDQNDIILIENHENAGFPAGCNQCIEKAAKDNDIFLLNNDALLFPESLFWLRMGLYKDSRTGAAGAVSNCVGNDQQLDEQFGSMDEYRSFSEKINVRAANPYESRSFLIMFAMLIKRNVLDFIGPLDERYTPGNFEDNDYGARLMQKGYDCVLCHNSYIYHFGSKSFAKDVDRYLDLYVTNREKFANKWGFYGDYHTRANTDLISMISPDNDGKIRVMQYDCGLCDTLSRIVYLFPGSEVCGVEEDPSVASVAKGRYDICCSDVDSAEPDGKFDYILMPYVIERSADPESIIIRLKDHLTDRGYIIASFHNLMNAKVIRDLLAGDFTYQDAAGIMDKRNRRLYTFNEINRLFEMCGYKIEEVNATITADESTGAFPELFEKILSANGTSAKELFDADQFIIKASRS